MGYSQKLRVLVLVKAAPQPSSQYGDTVCVAGVTLDEQPRWVRLYPVPFRHLDGNRQFRKYDILTVSVRSAGADKRPESRKINAESLSVVDHLDGWPKRSRWVEPLAVASMCEMNQAVLNDMDAPPLGAIRPRRVSGLSLSVHPGWSTEQRARFDKYALQGDLFRETPPKLLDAPRFKGTLQYFCQHAECNGHRQGIIDWEFTTLQHRFRQKTDESLKEIVLEKFHTQIFQHDTSPLIYVGNQENPRKRSVFSVLGIYYPQTGTTSSESVLF
ncbi:MAG: hypothetical protein ACRDRI_05535 [Pseudonocardiaceae bacterium]